MTLDHELLIAAERGELGQVERILHRDPSLIDIQTSDGDTALHLSAWQGHSDCLQFLLNAGAEVNRPGDGGRTALHYACEEGRLAVAEMLLSSGADPGLLNDRGENALYCAVQAGYSSIVELLQRHGSGVHDARAELSGMIRHARKPGDIERFELLVGSLGARDLDEILVELISVLDAILLKGVFGDVDEERYSVVLGLVKSVLRAGASVDGGRATGSFTHAHRAAQLSRPDLLEILFASGADLERESEVGTTVKSLVSENPSRDEFYRLFPMLRI